MLNSLRQKSWYRWCIVAAGFSVMATCYAGINNCFSLFYIPVSSALGFSRQEISFCQTIVMVAAMCATPVAGKFRQKFGLLRGMRMGVLLTVVCCALYGRATELWQFYIIALCLGLLQGLTLTMPVTFLVQNWFTEDLGLAIGIAFMGSGVGGMVLNFAIARVVERFGWQTGFVVMAAVMLLVAGPLVFLLAAENPRRPLARPEKGRAVRNTAALEIMRRGKFWLMIAVAVMTSVGSYTMLTMLSPHLQGEGYSPAGAATVVSLFMGALAIGKMLLGWLYDRMGLRSATLLSAGFVILGLVGGLFVGNVWGIVLVLLGGCIGAPIGTVSAPMIVRGVFGEEDSGAVLGIYTAAANLGCALGPGASGVVFDRMGSYRPMYILLICIISVVWMGYFLLLPKKEEK